MKTRAIKMGARAMVVVTIALSSVLTLAIAGLLALAFSHSGLRLAYDLARRHVPGDLVAEALDGTLAGPLRIGELRYRNDAVDLRMVGADFNWTIEQGTLHLSFDADAVEITPVDQPVQPHRQKRVLPALSLPFPVRLAHLAVRDLRIGGTTTGIAIEGSAAIAHSLLQIESLAVAAGDYRVQASGWLETRDDYPLDLQLKESITLPQGQIVTGTTRLTGSSTQLQVEQRVAGAIQGHFEGAVANLTSELRWQIQGELEPTPLAPFNADLRTLVVSGTFSGEGGVDALSTTLSYHVSGVRLKNEGGGDTALGDIEGDLEASLAERMLSVKRLQLRHPDSGTAVSGTGSFNLDTRALVLSADWKGERIPRMDGAAPLPLATAGTVNGRGTIDDYAFDGHSKLAMPGYPQADVSLAGTGTRNGVSIANLQFIAGTGKAEANGTVAWAPQLQGDLNIKVTDFDPSLLLPDWPGALSAEARLNGALANHHPTASLSLRKLSGKLRGFPLSAQGATHIAGDNVEIKDFYLVSGSSRASITGSIKDRWNLQFAIDSDNLAELLPHAGGSLAGQGAISGPRQHPLAAIDLDAAQLHYFDDRADSLKLTANLDTAAAGNIKINAATVALSIAGQTWRNVAVSVDGKMKQHRVTAKATREDLSLEIAAQGSLDQHYLWNGTLTQAQLSEPALGKWRLRAPAPLAMGRARADLQSFCLQQADAAKAASLCADGSLRDGNWRGSAIATELPLALFEPFWSDKLSVSGTLSGHAAVKGSTKGLTSGNGSLVTTAGTISLGAEATTVNYAPGSVKFVLNEHGLDAAIDWRFVNAGTIQGNVRLPGWRGEDGYRAQQAVDGRLHLNTTALPLVNVVSADLTNINGTINSDLQIAGTLGAPQISGQATLENGSAELPEFGVKLTNIQLALAAAPNREIDIQGSLRSGEGELRFNGGMRADPAAGWPLHLTATGSNLRIVDTREATAIASPQLTVKTAGNRLDLNGEIRIPQARLTPRKIPADAVKVSRDVTIVSRENAALTPADTPLDIHSKVRIILGDQVQFDGLGLRGRFDGELVMVDEPGKPSRGNGSLSIHDGVYQAYGQNLHISQGRLLFAGPADDPGLDVRATRTVGTVIAGINATGTVRNPQLKLFSTPAMSDSDALAYLLLGRPLNQASGSDGGMLMAAASGMGLGKGEEIAQSIGRSLGLAEVRIDTSGDTNGDTSAAGLVIGRYLSPKLYVRYLAGLFGAAGVLQLRYQLYPNIEVQTESGIRASADLFYSIER